MKNEHMYMMICNFSALFVISTRVCVLHLSLQITQITIFFSINFGFVSQYIVCACVCFFVKEFVAGVTTTGVEVKSSAGGGREDRGVCCIAPPPSASDTAAPRPAPGCATALFRCSMR